MKSSSNKISKKSKHKKRFRRFFFSVLSLTLVFYLIAGYVLFSFALERENFIGRITNKATNTAVFSGESAEEKSNWLTQNSKDLFIWSVDDLKLHALFASNPNGNHRYAIVCHGYSGRASHMSRYANNFYKSGYSVLVPDARAHGESEGNTRGMGYPERKDILLWINEILKMDSNAQIVLYGISMGAATVMFTAGEKALPKNVVCVIEDCGYTSVIDEISHQVKRQTKLPFSLLALSASVSSRFFGGYSFTQASCIKAVKNCKIPIFFIHGSSDNYVPFEMQGRLYDAADCQKEKLVIEGAGHAEASSKEPDMYWKAVFKFIEVYAK